MITSIIVWGSILGALLFSVAYIASPRIRAQVEQPKHHFQQQVQDFEKALAHEPQANRGHQDESK